MLVLSPTRELAAQIADSFRTYGKFLGLKVDCVFGGMPIFSQKKRLATGVDILVATPGRLIDLIEQRAVTLKDVEIFVLDEADQMMDLGFIHALKRIDQLLPKQRQTLFFSATMPKAIAELGNRFLNNPVRVSVAPAATTAERVEQFVTFVEQREKQTLLTLKLQSEEIDRALVFTRTKHGADRVVRGLAGAGIQSAAIHGNKSQGQRTAALQAFRDGKIKILVATDIAARGIDVPGVSHVFNFELPNVPEQYVHRIGRTARAGREGVAMSFVAGDERGYMKDIERLTGVRAMTLGLSLIHI
jgi:ATP-dependent RNA helicase RhlE